MQAMQAMQAIQAMQVMQVMQYNSCMKWNIVKQKSLQLIDGSNLKMIERGDQSFLLKSTFKDKQR